jgi:arylsulfatase
MIRNLDTHVGRMRDLMQELGIDRDTLLIFMTDNGSTFGPFYYNAGMRGAKVSLWEGGHRVPCFIHWPDGNLGEPRDITGLTEVQDILPTLIDVCGLEVPEGQALDGISLADVLRDEEPVPPNRTLAVNYSRMPRFDYPMPDSRSVIRREGTAVLWKRWRLLEAVALYDLDNDPAQEHNVIDQYPEVAQTMLEALDAWWQDVEPTANQIQRVIIGSDEENPMMLSACEWRDVFVDQQKQVRIGARKNSYWHLQVDRAGTYRFELRRWPVESQLRLTEACPATEVTDGFLEEGTALPIAQARLMIDGDLHVQPVEPEDASAVFTVDLKEGPILLHTWFDDENHQPICGAYYVYVTRMA